MYLSWIGSVQDSSTMQTFMAATSGNIEWRHNREGAAHLSARQGGKATDVRNSVGLLRGVTTVDGLRKNEWSGAAALFATHSGMFAVDNEGRCIHVASKKSVLLFLVNCTFRCYSYLACLPLLVGVPRGIGSPSQYSI